jgi:hypothetical protein
MTLDELMSEVCTLIPGAEMVDDLTNSGRAVLARITVDGQTFIAKSNKDPDRFANEVSALQTLPAEVRPALVSVGERVVVMEDLGNGPSLADLLLGSDSDAAHDALLLWARTLGAALAPSLRRGARPDPLDLQDPMDNIVDVASTFGVAAPAGLADDQRVLEAVFNTETDWFAFGPSDACPDNNRVFPNGTLKFFDFEGAGWRHAASEAAYTRAPFCTCWCVAALPDGTTNAMEDAFMAALDPPSPDAFRVATGAAAIAYVLQTMRYFRQFLDSDAPVAPPGVEAPSRGRQYVHGRLLLIAEYADTVPALAQLAASTAAAMRDRWPDCTPLPLYPAFRATQ